MEKKVFHAYVRRNQKFLLFVKDYNKNNKIN